MGAHNASKPKSRSQSLSDIPTINNLAGTSFRSSLGLWPPHPRTFNHRRKLQLRVGKRRPQSWTTFCLKWTAIAYCALSSIFLSMDLCKIFHRISQHTSKYSTAQIKIAPATINISSVQLLSRITGLQQPPATLYPRVFGQEEPEKKGGNLTACLVVDDQTDTRILIPWIDEWPGPISLLVTTTTIPFSKGQQRLVNSFQSMYQKLERGNIAIHFLHIVSPQISSGNAHLNLARMLSTTNTVALFPGNASTLPSYTFFEVLSRMSLNDFPHIHFVASDPLVSPLVIASHHELWCTERFLPFTTWRDDWQECLWQFHLESQKNLGQGRMAEILGQERLHPSLSKAEMAAVRRAKNQFRAESCEMALRESEVAQRGRQHSDYIKHLCATISP